MVHQEIWQHHKVIPYGCNHATYSKKIRYDLALFFICVQTNVGYQVVSDFKNSIRNGRTDNRITHHSKVFESFLEFHREQARETWVTSYYWFHSGIICLARLSPVFIQSGSLLLQLIALE